MLAVAAAPIGIVVTDPQAPDNPVIYVNEEFSAITGYAPDELIGRNLRLLQGPQSEPEAIAAMHEAIANARAVAITLTNYRKSGDAFPMRVDIRPVFTPDGGLAAFVGGLTDLSEQYRAQAAQAETEERLRAVMAAIPLPMITIREDGTIARANSAAHETLGARPDSLPGRNAFELVLEDALDPGRVTVREALAATGSARRVEMRARRLDGTLAWVLVSAQRYTVRGETRTLAVFQDVTSLKLKEQALTRANEEAERNIRARMRFLAAASHDLRQPLQAMALFASALDGHVATPQGHNIVQSLKSSLRAMEEMFESLLDMSKLDAGVMKANVSPFMINDVFETLEMTFAPQAEAAGLQLRVIPSSLALRSDPKLVARILANFLSNAIRYTPSGRILLGARRHGDSARLVVCDTGPGIAEERRLDIFREFSQAGGTTSPGRSTGMGLGLSIVQRLALLLGHRLELRSVMGKGAGFSVEIPLAADWQNEPSPEAEDGDLPDVTGAVVMVVDDDRDIREGIKMLLEGWGCRTVTASNASDALTTLHEAQILPDMVLADLHLPGEESGLSVIRDIRARVGRPIPAFVLTGDTEACSGCETDERIRFLRKPLDPLRLRDLVADSLRR